MSDSAGLQLMNKDTERFYQRFLNGKYIGKAGAPRIRTEESELLFPLRDDGLKILMINPPIREWSFPNIMPLGHGYVGSVAKMDGHRVSVLDLNAMRLEPTKLSVSDFRNWIRKNVIDALNREKPDVIGIGGIITQYGRIKEITQLCKDLMPDIPIVLGGGIASCLPRFMVERLPIDVAVLNEGEVIFSEVLERFEKKLSFEGCEGVAYRYYTDRSNFEVKINPLRPSLLSKDGGLDHLPWPLRSHWPIEEIYKKNPVGHLNWESKWKDGASTSNLTSVAMLASRGCPYAAKACDYCYASYLGKTYRLRSPKEVVDEMEYIVDRFGADYIHFLDDLLMTDYRWALEFFAELKRRKEQNGMGVMWGGTCRTNIIADDVVRAKKQGRPNILEAGYEVGMRQAGFGVESASPTILKAIDKSGQTIEKIEIAILETQRVLGYADCSFMIGSPGESKQTISETVDVCKRIGLKPEVFFFTTAYPATSFWQLALDKGLIRKAVTGNLGPADDDIIEKYFLLLGEQGEEVRTNFSDLPDEDIVELSWWAVKELGAQNTVRHPHSGDEQELKKAAIRGASKADL